MFDSNYNGMMTTQEFYNSIVNIGANLTEDQIKRFAQMFESGTAKGHIKISDLCRVIQDKTRTVTNEVKWHPYVNKDQFSAVFSQYDVFRQTFNDFGILKEAIFRLETYSTKPKSRQSLKLFSLQESVILTHQDILHFEQNVDYVLNMAK